MVLSYYIYRIPYTFVYRLLKKLRLTVPVVFYCPNMLDWEVFSPVQAQLQDIPIVSQNPEVKKFFYQKKKSVLNYPVFPDAVIMCRHACHKFPAREIKKIGMRHGPYHFKRMTRAENYQLFDLYLMTSRADVEAAKAIGVHNAKAVGFPKLDNAFNSTINEKTLNEFAQKASIDRNKKTLLFTATWTGSGMSALERWSDHLQELADMFNVLVTLHPWVEKRYREKISQCKGVYLIEKEATLPYIMLADYCIGDTSSILAECSALNKPLITFITTPGKRSLIEIEQLLDRISLRIEKFSDLLPAIEQYSRNPTLLEIERGKANNLIFDELDGKASSRAVKEIVKVLPKLKKKGSLR